ncbi:MAG: alpha/beta fold hydrolase [Anaerolineales bacterium]|nr:alpha/beta fold hydrolase [Anaerolineales bacterium]
MTEEMEFTMAYLDSCDRPTLLLIHGFPFSSAMWELQIEDLGDLVRVVAPDLRGFGRSSAPPPPYTVGTYADDCADLLDYLAIPGPVVVGGLSMGGYVALEFYRRYPERVAGLILAATRAGADSESAQAGRDATAEAVQEKGVDVLVDGMLPKLLAPETAETQPDVVDFVRELIEGASVNGAVGALMAMKTRPDSTGMLADIGVPTLIIHGADDALIPLAEAQAMYEAIPDAELVVVPDAGHLPNLEQPDVFSDAVADFLEMLIGE